MMDSDASFSLPFVGVAFDLQHLAMSISSSSFALPRSDHVTWQLLYIYPYNMN